MTDYQGYVFDISIEEYFNSKAFQVDQIDNSKLNLKRQSHQSKFSEKVEEQNDSINLEEIIKYYCNSYAMNKILEQIDYQISYAFRQSKEIY